MPFILVREWVCVRGMGRSECCGAFRCSTLQEHLRMRCCDASVFRWLPQCFATRDAAAAADDNGIRSLPAGAYLDRLRVLGIDWRVLFNSHTLLAHARRLDKLCLMSIGKLEAEAAGEEAEAGGWVWWSAPGGGGG